jgi:hypothetical protein
LRLVTKIRNISLTLVLSAMFLCSIGGQFWAGYRSYQEELKSEHLPRLASATEYLYSGQFISSVFENMESEFLQMALFVFLTIFLYQIGSAESKKPPEQTTAEDRQTQEKEKLYCRKMRERYPFLWPLYESSLSLTLALLFVISFALHGYGSMKHINVQKEAIEETPITYWQVFEESDFWFESFQNWQSEFFSIAVIGLLSISLRQRGSAQSKKMHDPNWFTEGS